jgi:plasmid stabilization system protein ParE
MSEFVFHPDALKDLDEIWEYIAGDTLMPQTASETKFTTRSSPWFRFPMSAHQRPDLTSQPLRFQTVRDYVMAYAAEEKPLAIVALLHGRRNPRVIAAILRNRT